MRETLALVALAGLSCSALAQERVEFKGVPLGSTMQEFQAKNPLFVCDTNECTLPYLERPDLHCQRMKRTRDGRDFSTPTSECLIEVAQAATYGNRPARLRARFRDGALSGATASISPENFSPIIEALAARYGRPSAANTETVQNRMGATFQNETAIWNVGGDRISAQKYSSTITRGFVDIRDAQDVQRLQEQIDKRRKSAPSDL